VGYTCYGPPDPTSVSHNDRTLSILDAATDVTLLKDQAKNFASPSVGVVQQLRRHNTVAIPVDAVALVVHLADAGEEDNTDDS
tara:strand:+ start:465 stop:713 length:249 start_codon:yes stop_codon:yes gene_type:complete